MISLEELKRKTKENYEYYKKRRLYYKDEHYDPSFDFKNCTDDEIKQRKWDVF